MAARRCLRIILQHLSSRVREPHNAEKESKMLGSFVSESVKVCRRVTFMALFVFKKEAGEKDVSPSFADMSDSINEALRNCKSFPTLEEQIGYQHCIELLSSFCWLNTKASTLLLGELGRIMTIDNLDVAFRKKILSDQNFNEIVEVFRETLLQCRHKGVIENSNVGFQTLCKSVASISSMTNVLNSWVVDTINAVDQNDLNSSVTKRSAGLPMFLGPLMSACVSSRRFDFAAYIEKVLDIAKRPLTTSHEEQTDLPQVQAMNILKTMYRDSWLGSQALKYAQEGLMLCVDGFSSPSWAVRNAAQILLGSLVPRMFGQRVTQVDESHHNSLSAMKFFEMYPKLKEFFMEKLQCEGAADQQLKNLPALIPILTMLSRMRPCSDEMLRSDFCPLLERLISCPVFAVRQLAAFSLVLFLPGSELEAFVHLLLDHTTSLNENLKHGIMLMIKRLIQIKDDEKTVGDCVSSGTLLALSRSMLQNEFAKTLAICTLFEIFVNVFPKICSSSDEDDVLLRDYIQSSLGMLLTTVTDVTKTADEPGVYLYLKRLAQLVVAFSFHWQNIDAGFAAKVLSTTLASGNYHLLTETASELTNYFKRGDYFKSPLKTETLSKIYNQISLSEATGFQSVMMDCYSYAQKGLESFRSPVENTLTYFNSYLNMNMSETSHKYLASLMPFMGSLMKQFYSHSAANLDVINEVSKIWSEKLVTLCLPEERESLRWSCVEAVGWTTGTFLRLFKQYGEAAVSPWTGTLALVCARLIFAALTLSQDEDENIRNSVTDIALTMSETSEESVPQQLHPNLAIKVIFKYIQENMKNNVPLFEVLLGSLSDLVREKASPAEQTRSTFLFEQESSNLFAEKVVYAKQVIGCLEEFAKYIMEDREKQLEWLQKMTNNLNDFSEQIIEKHQLWTGTKGELSQDNMSLALFGDTGNSSIYLFLTVAFALLEIAKCVNANEMVFKMTELVQKNLKLENLHPLLENGFKKCLDEKEQAE